MSELDFAKGESKWAVDCYWCGKPIAESDEAVWSHFAPPNDDHPDMANYCWGHR